MGRSRRGRVASSGGASSVVGDDGSRPEKRNLYLYLYLYIALGRIRVGASVTPRRLPCEPYGKSAVSVDLQEPAYKNPRLALWSEIKNGLGWRGLVTGWLALKI